MKMLHFVVQPSKITWGQFDGPLLRESGAVNLKEKDMAQLGAVLRELIARIASQGLEIVGYRNTRWEFVERGKSKMIDDIIEAAQAVGVIRLIAEHRGLPVIHVPVSKREVSGGAEKQVLQFMAKKTPLLLRYPGDDLPDGELEHDAEADSTPPEPRPERPDLKFVCFENGVPVAEVRRPAPDWVYCDTGDDETSYYESVYTGPDGKDPPSRTHYYLNGSIRANTGEFRTAEEQIDFLMQFW